MRKFILAFIMAGVMAAGSLFAELKVKDVAIDMTSVTSSVTVATSYVAFDEPVELYKYVVYNGSTVTNVIVDMTIDDLGETTAFVSDYTQALSSESAALVTPTAKSAGSGTITNLYLERPVASRVNFSVTRPLVTSGAHSFVRIRLYGDTDIGYK